MNNWQATSNVLRLSAIVLWSLLVLPLSSLAGTAEGFGWLATQQNTNGSFGSTPVSLATPVQTTAEVLRALQSLVQQSQPVYAPALTFLNTDPESNTEFLARKIIINVKAGNDVTALVNALVANQNTDGGFGNGPGEGSSIYDTAHALEALAAANYTSGQIVGLAAGYLLNRQQANGGWLDGANSTSVPLTAQALRALFPYRKIFTGVATSLASGQNYLLSQRNPTGLWNEPFETATALTAVIPMLPDLAPVTDSLSALQASQLSNGSWVDDAYTTALALQALYLASQPRNDPTLGAVAGQVRDSASGSPLAGVTITAIGAVTRSAVSGVDGRYAINDLPPGPVNLTAALSGYLTTSATGSVPTGAALTFNPVLARDPSPSPLTLRGAVVRKDSGAPLSGATVSVANTAYSTATGADGRFELAGVPPGSYSLLVQLPGFLSGSYLVSASGGGLLDLGTLALDTGTTGATTGTLQGSVMDALNGTALRNVAVSVTGADTRTVLTDVAGQFAITDVVPGAVTVTASLDGYHSAVGSGTVVAGGTLVFNAKLVKAENPARVTVTGNVVDAATRAPLPGVNVQVANSPLTALTSAAGSFEIADAPPGSLTVTFSLAGYNALAYSVSTPNGGLVMLGTVSMAATAPITGNRNPTVTSTAPTLATAGRTYAYNVTASDPDGDVLTFGLATSPPGMTINPTSGQLLWYPTIADAGARTFTVVVFDTQGARAEQVVNLNVSAGGSRSYVITDVQTLRGLYIDSVAPNNYVLGTYVSGAANYSTIDAPPCGSANASSVDPATAVNALDRLTSGRSLGAAPVWGSDLVMDLGQDRSSVVVFPQIDHDPFPQEGIEYTVWGSNDPNAVFPDGWKLATLLSIYRQGYVQDSGCVGQPFETDDYAGLYTFGLQSFRYVRVRSEYSISIFDTPEHTTWSASGDDSGEPGWQSWDAEIDAVGGMVCDVKPTADAGADILGVTGQAIQLDGSASQGSILIYGWDLDGDGTIDLSGPRPSKVFTAEYDRDVTLMVVDNRGCVGTDTVRVTVGLNFPRPDLVISALDTHNVTSDPQTLRVSGAVRATVQNIGRAPAATPALVTVFEDLNRNGLYDSGLDNVLGSLTMPSGLARAGALTLDIPVNSATAFRDTALYAMVDSDRAIIEEREDNNVAVGVGACQASPPPVGTLQPKLKWAWTGSTQMPYHNQVMSIPIVAPLEDTNGDGRINSDDIPAVIFHAFAGANYSSDGVLRAVSGKDGRELWVASNSAYRTNPAGSIAVADIDNDGVVEIIAPKNGGGIIVFEHTGAFKWQSTVPAGVLWGGASIADLDGDGTPEIIVGNTVVNADGTLRWQGTGYQGSNGGAGPLSIVVDINLDGIPEVIAGGTAYSSTGQVLWQNTMVDEGLTAIGNFNSDPYPEIAVVARGRVFLLDRNGAIVWGPVTIPGGGSGGAPTVADVDGNGLPEIGVAGAGRYSVFKADGSVMWSVVTQDFSSNVTGSSVFDFDGDGQAEVVYADERFLRVYRGTNGAVLYETPNTSGTTYELPVIADVDNDGHADIVVCTNDYAFSGYGSGIRAYTDASNSWVPTRKIWNQHSYHITNINDDGTVPRQEAASWLTHNSYRLNAFPERRAPAFPDLTASLLRVSDNGLGQATVSVRIGNGGGAVSPATTVAFYEGDPAAGGRLLGSVPVPSLAAGAYQDISLPNVQALSRSAVLYVFVDPANQISECREDNNLVSRPVQVQSSLGGIAVSTDSAVYGPASPVSLRAAATNTSALPGLFRARLQVEDTGGVVIAAFATRDLGELAGGATASFTEPWNTGGFLAGDYVLRGRLLSVDGAVLDEAVTVFAIRSSATGTAPAATLRVTTDRPVYYTTDSVDIQSLIANVTANVLLDGVTLKLSILDSANQVVFTQSGLLGQLTPGALRDLHLTYTLRSAPIALYRVEGLLVDAAGNVLASGSTTYEVRSDLAKALTGKVEVGQASLYQGDLQTCTDTLTNIGTLPVAGLEVHHALVNLDTQLLVSDVPAVVSLIPNTPEIQARSFSTTGYAIGNYACVLQARIGSELKALAYAPFVLKEPPIRLDTTLRAGGKGRLLVLLDSPNYCVNQDADTKSGGDKESSSKDDQSGSGSCVKNRDPHGPKDAPSLTAQRTFLENLLKSAGWSYTVTETADAFTKELRSGHYNTYAVLAEQEKLSVQAQKELREAVFRGEGLLVAGSHDARHYKLIDALGVKLIGSVPGVVSATLLPSPLDLTGELPILPGDKALRIKPLSAQVFARYRLGGSSYSYDKDDDDKNDDDADCRDLCRRHEAAENNRTLGKDDDLDECQGNPGTYLDAATLNAYGRGKSAFVGFDLLASATRAGATSLPATTLLAALNWAQPTTLPALAGTVQPLELLITNRGIATTANVALPLPAGVTVLDAGGGEVIGNSLNFTATLAVGEEKLLRFWMKLPSVPGPVAFNATVSAGSPPTPKATAAYTVTVELRELGPVKTQIETLIAAKHPDSKALKLALNDVEKAYQSFNPDKAIEYVLKATDALLGLTDPSVVNVRAALGEWIRYASVIAY